MLVLMFENTFLSVAAPGLGCAAWASRPCYGAQALGLVVWHTGLAALQQVESFQTRDQTCVSGIKPGGILTTGPLGKS